ncbi:lytic murein transglycosylase B [Kangiella sp. TOML190]|uniref:lytic murein transglycosylase B n=1 Tax=Kangiella sp. TOML190 TaxID=2931351 RepID=UPI0035DCECE7
MKHLFSFALISSLVTASAVAADKAVADKAPTNAKDFASFMAQKHGFTEDYVALALQQAEKRQAILDAMSRPAEGKDWYQYRPIFLGQKRINKGVEFWQEHQDTLQRAEQEFQVPAEVIVAIIGVETFYGRIQGSFPVIDAISTLAFHYPKRAKFFAGELEQYFLLAREQGWDLAKHKGSYAGAMGMGQFIPTSYRHYAVDFDGDEQINLFENPVDAIGSVANYFKLHKWLMDEPVAEFLPNLEPNLSSQFHNDQLKPKFDVDTLKVAQIEFTSVPSRDQKAGIYHFKQKDGVDNWVGFHNFYVITRYNRSPMYAMAVHQLSQEIKAAYEQSLETANQDKTAKVKS